MLGNRKIGAHVSTAGGLINAVDNTLKIGGNCMQVFAGSPRVWARSLWNSEMVTEFKDLLQKHSLNPVFIHALYLVNLGSDNPDLFTKSVNSLKYDLQNGDQIGAAGVVVHVGSHQGRGFDGCQEQVVRAIQELLSASVSTPFVIETSAGQKGKIGSLDDIQFLLEALNYDSRVKVCLDTAHMFAAGYDLRKSEEISKIIEELKRRRVLPAITCIHLNDSKADLGSGRDLHENLGEGKIGLEALGDFINRKEIMNLPIILEVPGEDKKGPDMINIKRATGLAE